jgi:hypothetical protein
MSSAHVYLRLPEGAGIDDIPADTLEDCAQLVKQNSIQGGLCLCYDNLVAAEHWAGCCGLDRYDAAQQSVARTLAGACACVYVAG